MSLNLNINYSKLRDQISYLSQFLSKRGISSKCSLLNLLEIQLFIYFLDLFPDCYIIAAKLANFFTLLKATTPIIFQSFFSIFLSGLLGNCIENLNDWIFQCEILFTFFMKLRKIGTQYIEIISELYSRKKL